MGRRLSARSLHRSSPDTSGRIQFLGVALLQGMVAADVLTGESMNKNYVSGFILCAASALAACIATPAGKPKAPAIAPPVHAAAAPPSVAIIPVPRSMNLTTGRFALTPNTRVLFVGEGAESAATYLVDLLQRTTGMALAAPARTGERAGAIRFELTRAVVDDRDESYALQVSPEGIQVRAPGTRGLFYGAVTLWQMFTSNPPSEGGTRVIPAASLEDAPRFAWRGLMLDSARHYQSPRFIKLFIDWMALHKLNVFHWHLTDDQAWRLEIKKYPKLTSVGAWRVPAGNAAASNIDPATGQARQVGGFYTQEEVRSIVKYAALRHITVVPEIEMPGHASAAVVAYPELGVSRHLPTAVPEAWGVFTTLFNADESTFTFLEDVLRETMQLFPSEYIHVGGDEAVKDEWKASAAIQARMRKLGVKDEQELQSYFVQRMEKFLNANGRKLIGWDEILEGGVAPNATVMSWRGVEGAVAAAQSGHDTVLSPAPQLYLDHWQFDDDPAPGRSNTLSLEDVYRFDPAPPSLGSEQRKHILGLQANIWTEFMRSGERVEYMAFPRAAALAEVAWSAPAKISWADFQQRLPVQLKRYDTLGIRYAHPLPVTVLDPHRRTSHQLDSCGDGYLLSLEDDAPLQGERAVFLVNITNPCWIFRGAELSNVGSIRAAVGQLPFNFQIGDGAKSIPLYKPQKPAGELEVRLDTCDGALLASLPLSPATFNDAVTPLPQAALAPQTGSHDLCLRFTREKIDPIWVIDSVELVGN